MGSEDHWDLPLEDASLCTVCGKLNGGTTQENALEDN